MEMLRRTAAAAGLAGLLARGLPLWPIPGRDARQGR
jgi:hypothetical protein